MDNFNSSPGGKNRNKILIISIIIAVIIGAVTMFAIMKSVGTAKPEGEKAKSSSSQEQASSGSSSNNWDTSKTTPKIDSKTDVYDENVVTDIAEKVSPAVVQITNYDTYFTPYTNASEEVELGYGSGVVISSDGYIVTNNHVVADASRVAVELYNGEQYDAKIIGTDSMTDLALVKIEAKDLTAANLGDSSSLKVGQMAIAIGNPVDSAFSGSVTFGIISGLDRKLADEQSGFQLNLIQTDAAINPGNSGGALVNSQGEVIGINSAKISGIDYEGMNFSIPSNSVKEVVADLKDHGKVIRPALGVIMLGKVNDEVAKYYDLPINYGILIEPQAGGPAYSAGLRKNDIIIAVDGEKIVDSLELQQKVFAHKVGDTIKITVQRNNNQKDFNIKLGELDQ